MPTVLRAETFYLPPPTLPADAWDLVPAAERALRWYEVHAQRRLPGIAREVTAEPLYPRIDAGRWVAQCGCGAAQVVSPADPRMLCEVCLDGWHPLVFPEDPAAAEAKVADRLRRYQFWYHPDDEEHASERLQLIANRRAAAGRGD
jgi:hypothetical protein